MQGMRRKAYAKLKQWKERKGRQALLVTGARQVGKTYLIREFARAEYDVFVEFNLLLDNRVRASFASAESAGDLSLRISVAADRTLVMGKTLIFIDEVQECPEIVTFIKGLVDEGRYDYVLSGSLLGVELKNIRSWPVGYLSEVRMYPLDFEEFCWANGLTGEAFDIARSCFAECREVPDFVHVRLTELFHRYLLVGGMPDVVTAFVEEGAIDRPRALQADIRTFYEADISKYAPEERRLVIHEVFRLIPSELQSQNRRFRLSSITGVKRFDSVQNDFLWLTNANVALPVYNVFQPTHPLLMNDQRATFKLFMSDVGLLTGTFRKRDSLEFFDGAVSTNMGGVYENYVAQELSSHGFDLYYFTKRGIGELDFLVEDGMDRVLAFEVKSGRGYRTHAALDNALAKEGYGITSAYVLAETNVSSDDVVTYLPLYMAGLFGE